MRGLLVTIVPLTIVFVSGQMGLDVGEGEGGGWYFNFYTKVE